MKVVVISPPEEDSRETAVLMALFGAGLERYHVRKPSWSRERLADWIRSIPKNWLPRLVLHQHHDLVDEFGLGGRHWRDDGSVLLEPLAQSTNPFDQASPTDFSGFRSRSCHDLDTLKVVMGRYDAAFVGPIYPSISKVGYQPNGAISLNTLYQLLRNRTAAQRRTQVIALGGLTAKTAPRCRDFGFDGVATLGALWNSDDPVHAYNEIRSAVARYAL